ncbi:MAG: hypothetical protein ABI402_21375 [Ferruginibacter sp.]
MNTINVIIERSNDMFSAYAENVEGIYGGGDTIDEVKQSIEDSIELYKSYNKDLPAIIKGKYKLSYKFDTESFIQFYKGIFTNAALERLTGINQKQIHHYATGFKKPRPAQAKKIEAAMHKLGSELMAVEL